MTATARTTQPPRRTPQRTCVVCRTPRAKHTLIRLTKPAHAPLIIDQRARTPGRGAYLCPNRTCWTHPTTTDQLTRALHHPLNDHDRTTLHTFANTLPTPEPERNPQ